MSNKKRIEQAKLHTTISVFFFNRIPAFKNVKEEGKADTAHIYMLV